MTLIASKRWQQSLFEGLATQNRGAGSGGGTGMLPVASAGLAAGGGGGPYSTANSSTWADITGSSFTIVVGHTSWFYYNIFCTAKVTVGANQGYIRGNIVGFNTTASLWFQGSFYSSSMLWYYPQNEGPFPAGTYTVKMQAATDAGHTIAPSQFFHEILLFNQ